MKIIAFYLPQFHSIPENDKWWGEGFTEWVNVRKAKPLFEGHYQPRVPLNNNYYDLLDTETMRWQISMAKEYGLYGFCFYHYWFSGKMLLEKPVNNYLINKDLDFPFCICWANENWTNGWAAKSPEILMEQSEGNIEEWEQHFQYFLPFFKDERYICENGKPILVIYKPDLFPHMPEILEYWDSRAKEEGLSGLTFAAQLKPESRSNSSFDMLIEYQPTHVYMDMTKTRNPIIRYVKNSIKSFAKTMFGLDLEGVKLKKLPRYSYDDFWKKILNIPVLDERQIPGAFIDWDNTPRKGNMGYVIEGANPVKFKKYLTEQIRNSKENYKKEFIFVFAWNEWAESGYFEPDEKYRYGYLEALKEALIANGE